MTISAMPNVITATMRALEAQLTNVVIYGSELPESDANAMPMRAIVVAPAGGSGPYGPVHRQRVDLVCYGRTPLESQELFGAAQAVLLGVDRAAHGAALLYDFVHEAGPLSAREPATRWPFTWGTFLAQASVTSI